MSEPKLDPDLLDELTAEPVRYNSGCTLGRALPTLDAEVEATFRHALGLDEVKTVNLVAALRRYGVRVDESTVRRHRRGGCKCSEVGL